MSKSEPDNEYYAPKTDNQQVVFDYLESLLEDPDTLAHDTMEELKAIGALEHTEPEVAPVAEDIVPDPLPDEVVPEESGTVQVVQPQVVESGVNDVAVDIAPEQLVEDDLPVADAPAASEPALEEPELIDTPADLMEVEGEFNSSQADFEPAREPVSEESKVSAEPEVLQVAVEVPAVAKPVSSAAKVASESVQVTAPAVDPAVESTPKPAVHVAEGVLNCILFQLQGLTLAIPVDDVEGAISMEQLTLHLDLEHEWVLGFFDAMGKETSVVDTGSWLLPGRFDAAQANYEDVLILKGRRWSLACDALVKSVRMPHSDIVWAGENKSRPWLLGTNMTERCAILDADKLQMLLNQQA